MLAIAPAAICRAAGSLGRCTSGAGRGSSPTNRSGMPVSSSRRPSSAAISVGAGRIPFRPRTTNDVCAWTARKRIGPAASRPPMSQIDEDRLGRADDPAERPVDPVEDAAAELGRDGPPDGPAERLADARRGTGSRRGRRSPGRPARPPRAAPLPRAGRRSRDGPAPERADEAADLGQRAGADADEDRPRREDDDDDVEEVHRREVWLRRAVTRPDGGCGAG